MELFSLEILAFVNYTAQHSIPIVVNTLSNMYAKLYGLNDILLTSQPFTNTALQKG